MESLAVTALIIRLNLSLTVHWKDDVERKKLILNFASYSESFVTEKTCGVYLSCLSVMTQSKFCFVLQKCKEERTLPHPHPLGFQYLR